MANTRNVERVANTGREARVRGERTAEDEELEAEGTLHRREVRLQT